MRILTDQRRLNAATLFPVPMKAKYETMWLPLASAGHNLAASTIPFPSMTYIIMPPQDTLGSRMYLHGLSAMAAVPSFPACQSKSVQKCWSISASVRCLFSVTFGTTVNMSLRDKMSSNFTCKFTKRHSSHLEEQKINSSNYPLDICYGMAFLMSREPASARVANLTVFIHILGPITPFVSSVHRCFLLLWGSDQ